MGDLAGSGVKSARGKGGKKPSDGSPSAGRKTAKKVSNGSEAIAQAAYERWLSRGAAHGGDMEDWFEAEKEILTSSGKPRVKKP